MPTYNNISTTTKLFLCQLHMFMIMLIFPCDNRKSKLVCGVWDHTPQDGCPGIPHIEFSFDAMVFIISDL